MLATAPSRTITERLSLYEGLAGTAYYLADVLCTLLSGEVAADFPGFDCTHY